MAVSWVVVAMGLDLVFFFLKNLVLTSSSQEGSEGVEVGSLSSSPWTLGDGRAVAGQPAVGQGLWGEGGLGIEPRGDLSLVWST